MNNSFYDKLIHSFYTKIKEEEKSYFFKGLIFNPIKIYKIAESFKAIDLAKEDLILIYSKDKSIENADFILTNKFIHSKEKKVKIEDFDALQDGFSNENHAKLFKNFVEEVIYKKKDKINAQNKFNNIFKDFINKKETQDEDFDIDLAYLEILKTEGEKMASLCEDLNNNKSFKKANLQFLKQREDAVAVKSEVILLSDTIKIFNWLYPLSDKKNEISEDKLKFLLAFMFEKLQGKDIIKSLSISKINEFVESENFDKNIETIRKAKLFSLSDNYSNELLLPSILKRIEHNFFTDASAILYRIANLIAKADGGISEAEEIMLKKINDKIAKPKVKIEGVSQTEVDENETMDDVLAELNELIGLEEIKKSIIDLTNYLKIQKVREAKGLKTVNTSLHTVFLGPPGTGKTTVARLISRIYKHLGYLEKGHLVETDRSGMVAGYVGQTAIKVNEIVAASIEGVLFIDEAYALSKGNQRDFGNEAIETLLKKMEDHRKELVVIVAGYSDEMEGFIESNPGLQSRFNRYFSFDHYRPKELLGIFLLFCHKNDFILTEDAKEKMEFIFTQLYEKRHKAFGNARVARNLFEKIIEYQANRLVKITELTEEVLKTITEEDIPPVNQTVDKYTMFQKDDEGIE